MRFSAFRTFLLLLLFLAASSLLYGWQARTQAARNTASDPQFAQQRNNRHANEERLDKLRAKGFNKERQEALKKDTDRLLELATELKKSVDATSENVLSIEVIKKAEEVEKLAKSVKQKMKSFYAPIRDVPPGFR